MTGAKSKSGQHPTARRPSPYARETAMTTMSGYASRAVCLALAIVRA
jgi:hypothetical protein